VGHVRQPLGRRRRRRDAPRDRALAERLKRLAAHLLEAAPEDVELRDGRAQVNGSADRALAYSDLARVAYLEAQKLPEGEEPGLEEHASFDPPGTFSNATTAASSRSTPTPARCASSVTSSPRTAA
jgi:hypothetical protein